jgi:hypothetical protein
LGSARFGGCALYSCMEIVPAPTLITCHEAVN